MGVSAKVKYQRDYDRAQIASLLARGVPQVEIARRLNMSPELVNYHVKVIHRRWQEQALRAREEQIAKELAKIDEVEREAWVAWERSKGERQKTLTARENGQKGVTDKAQVEKQEMLGDPRYLDTVLKCSIERRRLLGLDAPMVMDILVHQEIRKLAEDLGVSEEELAKELDASQIVREVEDMIKAVSKRR